MLSLNVYADYWLNRRKKLEVFYDSLLQNEKAEIDDNVTNRFQYVREILKSEARHGNGVEKFLSRERRRLLLEEIAKKLYQGSRFPVPFQENSDGLHPGMVFIPAGKTKIGVAGGFGSREEPERVVDVPGFWIDVFATTNAQYQHLYHTHVPDEHSSDEDMPVVNVTWFDAHKFSSALGKRLPTQEEWEKAARGVNSSLYSFGNDFDNSKVNIWPAKGTKKVNAYDANSFGLYQTCGNVWEWTAEIYCHNIRDTQCVYYNLAKGGSWRHCSWGARATASLCLDLASRSDNVGFRCACSY